MMPNESPGGAAQPVAAEAPPPSKRWLVPLLIIVFLTILLLPAPAVMTQDGRVLMMSPEAHRLMAVTFLMAGLWVSQAIPLAATSLLPLVLFPFLGIQSAKDVSQGFVSDMLFLFIGGFIIALGLERWNLHRRIALQIVTRVGVQPKRLVLGMMLATAMLSMWISNTATTLLMLPLALALLKTIDESPSPDGSFEPSAISQQLTVPLLLGIAYAASLGGMTTIVGTPTNTAAVNIYQRAMPDAPELSVARWMMVGIPVVAVYLVVVWGVLTWRLPRRTTNDARLRTELRARLQALGPVTSAERRMMCIFCATAALWILRLPLEFGDWTLIPGWSAKLKDWFQWLGSSNPAAGDQKLASEYVKDSTVAVGFAVLLFFLPSGTRDECGRSIPLMNWRTAVRLPWEIILLFGGGLALAGAFDDRVTGLAGWIGQALQGPMQDQPTWLVISVICCMMTFLTEVTSNVATITTVLPSLLIISEQLGIDARLLLIPATLATSCAFMLPIATAPNAIVFGSGRITAGQMARFGVLLNLAGIPLLTVAAFWLIRPLFGIP